MRVHPLQNPFLALRPFGREDARRFFGRDADLVLVESRIYSAATTLLFAGSGVGKSSFINARLAPALEPEWLVIVHRAWAALPPLDALRATLEGSNPRGDAPLAALVERLVRSAGKRQCLLVLDQFEEVFQHWRDTKPLDEFATQVAAVPGVSEIDVRVLFSMREDFLGELSLFDNLLPDLFNNSYRLKNPTRTEAEEIIERTAFSEQRVECGPGLVALLDDLLGTARSDTLGMASTEPSVQSRVPMPFLQIVCHRLWQIQMSVRPGQVAPPTRFLETHQRGTATRELEGYCRDKLDALNPDEQALASAAFEYLMTPTGAKMAYPVDVLARQAKVDEAALLAVLRKLCDAEVRVLREIPASRGSKAWFELYHDLYTRFLSGWKREHDRRRAEEVRRREQQASSARVSEQIAAAVSHSELKANRYRRLAVLVPVALILAWAIGAATFDYFTKYAPLRAFAVRHVDAPDAAEYTAARGHFEALRGSTVWGNKATLLWSQYWYGRAQREALSGANEKALLSLARSLEIRPDDERARRQLANWLGWGGETTAVLGMTSVPLRTEYLPTSDQILVEPSSCRLVFWSRKPRREITTWSPTPQLGDNCREVAAVSADGAYAALRLPGRVALVHLASHQTVWTSDAGAKPTDAQLAEEVTPAWPVHFSADSQRLLVLKADRLLAIPVNGTAVSEAKIEASNPAFVFHVSTVANEIITYAPPDRFVIYSSNGARKREFSLKPGAITVPTSPRMMPVADGGIVVFSGPDLIVVGSGGERVAEFRDPGGTTSFKLTPDGRYIFSKQADGGFCRIPIDRPRCERYTMPAGLTDIDPVMTSAETLVIDDAPHNVLRELRLAPDTAGSSVRLADRRPVALSPDGRWLITSSRNTCLLSDLTRGGEHQLQTPECSWFSFSPTGKRLLQRRKDAALIDPETRQRMPVSFNLTQWLTDDYLTIVDKDGGVSLYNALTGKDEQVEGTTQGPFKPTGASIVPGCFGDTPTDIVLDPGQRYLVTRDQQDNLVMYHNTSGRWSKAGPVPQSQLANAMFFSRDTSALAAVRNGTVVSLWRTSQLGDPREFNDTYKPLCGVGLTSDAAHVFAVATNQGDQRTWLAKWTDEKGSAPVWRTELPAGATLRSAATSTRLFITAEGIASWLMESDEGAALNVRRVPSIPWSSYSAFGPVMDANGHVIVAFQDGGDAVIERFSPEFSEASPVDWRLAGASPPWDSGGRVANSAEAWRSRHDEWQRAFGLALDSETGQYKSVTAAVAPPQFTALSKAVQESREVTLPIRLNDSLTLLVVSRSGQVTSATLNLDTTTGSQATAGTTPSNAPPKDKPSGYQIDAGRPLSFAAKELKGKVLTLTLDFIPQRAKPDVVDAAIRLSGRSTQSVEMVRQLKAGEPKAVQFVVTIRFDSSR